MTKNEKGVRQEIARMLEGGVAFMTFDEAVVGFPMDQINTKPTNVDYTFWHLLEHIRITQWDIFDFCINPNYKYISWPNDYWPKKSAKATPALWQQTIKQIQADTKAMIDLVENPKIDLYTPFKWGEGQNLLREALLVAQHNAYHTGEFAILRQVASNWPKGH